MTTRREKPSAFPARPAPRLLWDTLPRGALAGKRCLIIGGGPSARPSPVKLRTLFDAVIAVNPPAEEALALERLADHALIVTADPSWRAPETTVAVVQAARYQADVRHPVWLPLEPDTWGVWPDTANSGLVALWLAWQLGADPILLVGFDGGPDAQGRTHYHKTASPDEPFYSRSRAALESLAPQIGHRVFHLVEPVNRQGLSLWNDRKPESTPLSEGVFVEPLDSTDATLPVSVVMAFMRERNDFRNQFVMPAARASGAAEIVLVQGDGRRPAEALNLGLRHASQPYVLFLDDDCVLAADALQRMIAALEADPSAAVAYGDYLGIVHPGATPHPCGPVWLQRTGPWDVETLKQRNLVPSIALWRRSLMPRDPLWDPAVERLYDWDLALTLTEHGGHGVHVPGVLFHAHWLPGVTETNDSVESSAKREASKALIREQHRACNLREQASKPRILLLSDTPNWAWARKSKALQRWLSDEFNITIRYHTVDGWKIPPGFDLVHTFELSQVPNVHTSTPLVTGITAHVISTWETRVDRGFGPGTVKRWADRAVALHANSRLLQDELQVLLDRPVHYTPNGVDEEFFHRTRPHPEGPLVVGWVGKGTNPRKGLHIVREACEIAGVELRVIDRRASEALPPEAMREFYNDCHVIAVASDFDGTPNMVLEGAACECAVVGNRIGNLPEFIEHGVNGLLVDRSVDGLASGLAGLSADLARALGFKARLTVRREWTWRHQAENYRAMWRECLR